MVTSNSFIETILQLLNEGKFSESAVMWREHQVERGICNGACPYGEGLPDSHCALCLEGRIRTQSLMAHHDASSACKYSEAANAIHNWLEMPDILCPAK